MNCYKLTQKVLFQHCDPAGIVFYPRYFEMINATVEQWFCDALQFSFATMHIHKKVGVPTVAIETQFKAASFLEDQLEFELSVTAIGRKSVDLRIDVKCKQELRLTTCITLVYVSLAAAVPQSIVWDESLKACFLDYLATSETPDTAHKS